MKFSGELEDVHESQKTFIENVLKEQGFDDCEVKVEPVGKKGDNYVANVKRIIAESNGKKLQMIAKVAPTLEAVRVTMFTDILFENETVVYTQLFPKFDEIQKASDIPESMYFKFPKCFGVMTDAPYECILLEDLQESNFEMNDKLKSLNNEEVKTVLDNLARFHALSFALKRQEPTVFSKFGERLYNLWGLMDEVRDAVKALEKLESEAILFISDESLRPKFKGTLSKVSKFCAQFMERDRDSVYSVIQQGDCWTNNIMFEIENSSVKDCVMIDYQLSRVASPVSDLMYCIFNCTDFKTRSAHYFDWIDHYHKQLDNHLNCYNLKANLVYPRDKLDVDLKMNGKCAFGLSVILATAMMKDSDDVLDLKTMNQDEIKDIYQMDENSKLLSKGVKDSTILRIKHRIQELFDSFIEYGYL